MIIKLLVQIEVPDNTRWFTGVEVLAVGIQRDVERGVKKSTDVEWPNVTILQEESK